MPRSDAAHVVPLRRGRNEREFLPAALEIIETPASPAGRAVVGVVVAALALAIVWASLGSIDVVATASGRLVPLGRVKTVQPFETGVVRAIRVIDGDHVAAGQPLIELDPTQAQADRDRGRRDVRQARLALARQEGLWRALRDGGAPLLAGPPDGLSLDERQATEAALAATAAEQAAKVADLDSQIAGKKAEVATAQAELVKLRASLALVEEEEALRRKVMAMEYGNRVAWLEAAQRASDQRHQITVTHRRQEAAEAADQALQRQREALVAGYVRSILEEREKDRARLSELEANLAKAEQRLALTTLTAPVTGTVQQLATHTVGGVVTPAQPVLVVVPDGQDDGGLEVEALVANKDIGFVHVGQPAALKVETFTFTRYGLIEGEVTGLSRDSVPRGGNTDGSRTAGADRGGKTDDAPRDGDGASPVYVAHIRPQRNWMETETGRVALEPGMTVTAEIKTGQRKAIDYLLSPMLRYRDESLRER